MNEYDYRFVEIVSLLFGVVIVAEWQVLSMVYQIPNRLETYIVFFAIAVTSSMISLLAYVKHHRYVREMKNMLEKERKHGDTMERPPV